MNRVAASVEQVHARFVVLDPETVMDAADAAGIDPEIHATMCKYFALAHASQILSRDEANTLRQITGPEGLGDWPAGTTLAEKVVAMKLATELGALRGES